MNLEQTVTALSSQNEQFKQENDQLKAVLGIIQENRDLRATVQGFIGADDSQVCACSIRTKPSFLLQTTCDEKQFRNYLHQPKSKHVEKTSSPIDLGSFILNSLHTDKTESQSCRTDIPSEVKAEPERLLGEIAFQLDRRILFYVFQGYKRLYGFTLRNIPDKIIEVSTHPLSGKVDEGYQHHLNQRYGRIMKRLGQLGYKTALHPPLAEFIVNTYGILMERPTDNSVQDMELNNPEFLKRHVSAVAPIQLKKELLLFLSCLCNMAEKDKKPLLLW